MSNCTTFPLKAFALISPKKHHSQQDFIDAIRRGDVPMLSQAITLMESNKPEHEDLADGILDALMPFTGNAVRVGVTGIPGVGKSTFIEKFGHHIASAGHKLAILAIDPTSSRTGGSILGDKTRMPELTQLPNVFIRPSPAGESLGGVARKTREAMLLCEAAGYNVILVETVGVGQSETTVHTMVDFFLLLLLAGSGDELQGIKRGIMELADDILINKADGENLTRSKRARAEFKSAMHLLPPRPDNWTPSVELSSGITGDGLPEAWRRIAEFQRQLKKSGHWKPKRSEQNLNWFDAEIKDEAFRLFREKQGEHLDALRKQVAAGELSAFRASKRFFKGLS